MNAPLAVLYEDADCLAVIKPAGQFPLGTWAPPGEMTLEQCVRIYLDPAHPESVYIGIVHRLDRPTSGVLLWAKTVKAARRLSTQFERRQVSKEYWAVVDASRALQHNHHHTGIPQQAAQVEAGDPRTDHPDAEHLWSDWLTRADRSGVVHSVPEGTTGARLAVTTVQVAPAAALPDGCQWLRLWPRTGRTHQLRAQAATRGKPILGDATYGSTSEIFAPQPMIALHARSLKLKHPILQHELNLVASLPIEWKERGLRLSDMAPP